MHVLDDLAVLLLGICLIICIAGIVTLTLLKGSPALAGTGLGGLTVLLAGALVYRVKDVSNGKDKK